MSSSRGQSRERHLLSENPSTEDATTTREGGQRFRSRSRSESPKRDANGAIDWEEYKKISNFARNPSKHTPPAGRTVHLEKYDVLPMKVLSLLTQYFNERSPKPSKADRLALFKSLEKEDASVSLAKVTRWFQNRREYVKRKKDEESPGSEPN